MAPPALGEVLGGKYRIERLLGEGGSAWVFAATSTDLGRAVAIKVLRQPAEGYDHVKVARFMREARTMASLQDPHTMRVFDVGRAPNGLLYMVLERLDGEDLAALLQRRGRLSEQETIRVLSQVLQSLREAHRVGILHRDIKPANLQVYAYADDPLNVKVLDFGISKSLQPDVPSLTATGRVLGTPRYMSPEALVGGQLTPAADLYSLGLVAFQMLTGRTWEVSAPVALTAADPVSPPMRDLINRMLARDLGQRFASARLVMDELERIAAGLPPAAAEPEAAGHVHGSAAPHAPPTTLAEVAPIVSGGKESGGALLYVAAAVIIVAILGLAGRVALTPRAAPPAPVARLDRPDPNITMEQPSLVRGDDADMGPAITPRPSPATRIHGRCGQAPPFRGKGLLSRDLGLGKELVPAYIPKSYDGSPTPVVLLYTDHRHGASFMLTSGLAAAAEDRGFVIVLVPQKRDSWRAKREHDAAYAGSHLGVATLQLCVDMKRVYSLAEGTGVALATRTRCNLPIRALATAGARPDPAACKGKPIPHIHFVDLKDPTVGGPPEALKKCGDHASQLNGNMANFMERWRDHNQCDAKRQSPWAKNSGCYQSHCTGAAFVTCKVSAGRAWRPELDGQTNECFGPESSYDYAKTAVQFFEEIGATGR